jgi:hypothetical protein
MNELVIRGGTVVRGSEVVGVRIDARIAGWRAAGIGGCLDGDARKTASGPVTESPTRSWPAGPLCGTRSLAEKPRRARRSPTCST